MTTTPNEGRSRSPGAADFIMVSDDAAGVIISSDGAEAGKLPHQILPLGELGGMAMITRAGESDAGPAQI